MILQLLLVDSLDCYDAQSCISTTINENSTTLRCFGFESCRDSHMNITGAANIHCYGAFSCYHASIIKQNGAYVSCHGLFSCSNINTQSNNEMQIITGDLYAYGELALYNSIVNFTFEKVYCACQGYKTCFNSIISINSVVNGNFVSTKGYLAAANSTIFSVANDTTVRFEATGSGQGQKFYA